MAKTSKQTKRRLIIFGGLSVLAIISFISSLIKYTFDIKKLKDEETQLTYELNELKIESDNLKSEIEKLKDPEYIARFAREEFSYSKQDGEYIIKIDEKKPEIVENNTSQTNDMYKYIITAIGLILICIIIYILKK